MDYTGHREILDPWIPMRKAACPGSGKVNSAANIQLFPEREVNSDGYIYPPLFTDPEGDSCFSIYQIR